MTMEKHQAWDEAHILAITSRCRTAVRDWSIHCFGSNKSAIADGIVLGSVGPVLGLNEEFLELMGATGREDKEDAIADILIYLTDYSWRVGYPIKWEILASCEDLFLYSQAAGWAKRIKFQNCETLRLVRDSGMTDQMLILELLGHGLTISRDLSVSLEMLNHTCLKSHQGIRGFDKEPQKKRAHELAMNGILANLFRYYMCSCEFRYEITKADRTKERKISRNPYDFVMPFISLYEQTVTSVTKRNWTENPVTAHEGA